MAFYLMSDNYIDDEFRRESFQGRLKEFSIMARYFKISCVLFFTINVIKYFSGEFGELTFLFAPLMILTCCLMSEWFIKPDTINKFHFCLLVMFIGFVILCTEDFLLRKEPETAFVVVCAFVSCRAFTDMFMTKPIYRALLVLSFGIYYYVKVLLPDKLPSAEMIFYLGFMFFMALMNEERDEKRENQILTKYK